MKHEKYALRYTINTEFEENGYTEKYVKNYAQKYVKNFTQGICDAMIFISILRQEDGSYSQVILSMDGQTKNPLTQDDLFKTWVTMGLMLADKKCLSPHKQELASAFAGMIKHVFKDKNRVD